MAKAPLPSDSLSAKSFWRPHPVARWEPHLSGWQKSGFSLDVGNGLEPIVFRHDGDDMAFSHWTSDQELRENRLTICQSQIVGFDVFGAQHLSPVA